MLPDITEKTSIALRTVMVRNKDENEGEVIARIMMVKGMNWQEAVFDDCKHFAHTAV